MKKVQEILEGIKVLNGWGGFNVTPEVDEKPEDIWMLILYDYHGDDFLMVRTRDGHDYEYGLYEHMKDSEFNIYARKPQLYKELDEDAIVANESYFKLDDVFMSSGWGHSYRKYESQKSAQWAFDWALKYIEDLRKTAEVVFDHEDYKRNIMSWLKENDIATDENIEKLKNTAFHNKVGPLKLIGVAGKMDETGYNYVTADNFKIVYVNGKLIDPKKVAFISDRDKWGVDIYQINLKGFCPSKAG